MLPVLRRLGAAVALALAASGCGFECGGWEFGPVEVAGARAASAPPPGPALTVALVETRRSETEYYVRAGAEAPAHAADSVRVYYGLDGAAYDATRPALEAVTVGDTVYVFPAGALDPVLFERACSPPVERLRFTIDGVAAPEAVGRVAFVVVREDELLAGARTALSAPRPRRPLTV